MRGFSYLVLIGILFLSACGSKKTVALEKATPPASKMQSGIQVKDLKKYRIPKSTAIFCTELEKASDFSDSNLRLVTIQNLKQFNGCLFIQFQYSGCSRTEAHLRWISTNNKHHQLALYVDNPGDCDMLIEEEWHFDLQELGPAPEDMILEFENELSAGFTSS